MARSRSPQGFWVLRFKDDERIVVIFWKKNGPALLGIDACEMEENALCIDTKGSQTAVLSPQ